MTQSCQNITLENLLRKANPLFNEISSVYSIAIQRLKQERISSLLMIPPDHLDKLDQNQKKIINEIKLKLDLTGHSNKQQKSKTLALHNYNSFETTQLKTENNSYQNMSDSIDNLAKTINKQLQISKRKDNPLKIKYQQQYLKLKLKYFKPKLLKIQNVQYQDFPLDVDYSKVNYLRLTSIDHKLATLIRKYFKNLRQLKLDESITNFNSLHGNYTSIGYNSPASNSIELAIFKELSKIPSLENLIINTKFLTTEQLQQYYSWFPKNKTFNVRLYNFNKFSLIQFILDNPNWEEIVFPGANVPDSFQPDSQLLDFIHKLIPNLKGIDISYGVNSLQTLKSIGKFHQLKKLKISIIPIELDNNLNQLLLLRDRIDLSHGVGMLISNLNNLITLDISHIQISQRNLQNIYNSCRYLQNFRFISNTNNEIESLKLINILIRFQKLKKLTIYIKQLTRKEWLQLSKSRFKLNSLILFQKQIKVKIAPIQYQIIYERDRIYYQPTILPQIQNINQDINNQVKKESSLFFKNQTTLKQFKMKTAANDNLCMSISQLQYLQTLYIPFSKQTNERVAGYNNYGNFIIDMCCFSNAGFIYLSKLRDIKNFTAQVLYQNTNFYISQSLFRFIRNNKESKYKIKYYCITQKLKI